MLNKFWFDAKNINCFKNGFRVIKDLNLKISYSENVILIGPNGSGKSSLIELINRNIYPVEANESKLKIFDKELINLWELRKKISTVNNDIKNRINPNLQVFDLILSGLYGRYCYVQNKLLNNLLLFKENQRKIFYKIFDEDYMILKTQTYNHDMGFINKDEIKFLGEDRIINYFWKWYKKSEDKDEPWENINNTQNLDVYDKVILKYPPEIKKLEIANNIDIIRKTFVRFAAPLIFFMLII